MSLTTRVIAGLALGLAAGAAAHFSGHPLLLGVADLVEPIGTIWVNAILMTVIPLVFSRLDPPAPPGAACDRPGDRDVHSRWRRQRPFGARRDHPTGRWAVADGGCTFERCQ